MTIEEFKAWFDGYTEDKESLSKKQLDLMKQKLSETYTQSSPFYPYYPMYPTYNDRVRYWSIPASSSTITLTGNEVN